MTPRHFWGQLLSRSAVKVRLFAGQALRVTRKNQRWTHYWKQLVVVADQQSQVAARDGFPDESGFARRPLLGVGSVGEDEGEEECDSNEGHRLMHVSSVHEFQSFELFAIRSIMNPDSNWLSGMKIKRIGHVWSIGHFVRCWNITAAQPSCSASAIA
jgi:hypothetical protein